MLTVGQTRSNGQHMTGFHSNRNHFNTLNSYFGCNSVYKNCFDYRNNIGFNGVSEPYRQAINGYGYPNFGRLQNEWPTLEESFGAGLKPQKAETLQWPQSCPSTQPMNMMRQLSPELLSPAVDQWTTNFWNNVNRIGETDAIQCTDADTNPMDWSYATESMVTSNNPLNGYQYPTKYDKQYAYERGRTPIGVHFKRDNYSSGGSSTDQSFDDGTHLNEETLSTISKMAQTLYIPPKVRRRQPSLMECVFCKNNNERPEFYRSHILKDPESNIQCPVLRAYNCPICHNGGGSQAHTIRYCPLNKAGFQTKLENLVRTQTLDALITDWSGLKKRRKINKKNQ